MNLSRLDIHLAFKNKVTTTEMVMDKLKGGLRKSVFKR